MHISIIVNIDYIIALYHVHFYAILYIIPYWSNS